MDPKISSLLTLPAALFAVFTLSICSFAGPASENGPTQSSTRYGLFGLLDHHSAYGQGVFPEPFRVDDSDLEVNEIRLDWLHTKASNQYSDIAAAEIEKGFGLLTLELKAFYERDASAGVVSEGVGNVEIGARHPIWQYVSGNGVVDSTLGVGVEVGIPVNSSVSKRTELVPKVFNDLKIGEHFTLQSVFGYSTLFGGGETGGLQTFEYGFVLGYTIQHSELAIPDVLQFIPIFELSGETELNHRDRGRNTIVGDLGFRADLKAMGPLQPRLGIGFVFPMNRNARAELNWGIVTSLVFEY